MPIANFVVLAIVADHRDRRLESFSLTREGRTEREDVHSGQRHRCVFFFGRAIHERPLETFGSRGLKRRYQRL